MNKIFNNFFLLVFFLLFCFQFSQADSSKIYKNKYQNPIGVLNSFLWSDEKGGYIGLTSKVNILSRNLNNTIHPVSIDSFKIKIAFSKLQFKNQDDDNIISIFNAENLEIISKNISRGLLVANNFQDIIFQLVQKNKKEFIRTTKGIAFVESNSLNLVFFNINNCEQITKDNKRGFYRRSQIFPKKKKKCENNQKEILVTSTEGIYKKETNSEFNWLVFTPKSWQIKSLN
ncbi:MAG: hypothetical protein CFH23_00295 [Alphaproteobacteria bacterium MarineAlpha6_Bin1]|nr:MAG: hypothetical protein CFH23_00295 [Alphaproteobacteria bacterium MarineAlpha6_Bin1]